MSIIEMNGGVDGNIDHTPQSTDKVCIICHKAPYIPFDIGTTNRIKLIPFKLPYELENNAGGES
jgi:hypothetical protein